jgi:Ca2+-binding EF-hand superfamily protein
LQLAERLDRMVHELLDWLSGAEKRLRAQSADGQSEQDAAALQRALTVQRTFESEMEQRRPLRDQCVELIIDLLRRCHPDAISPLNHWQTIVQSRWDEVNSWSRRSAAKLAEHVAAAEQVQQLTDQLSEWLMESERTLLQRNTVEQSSSSRDDATGSDLSDWQRLVAEHQLFIEQMSAKQPSVERVLRFGCTRRSGSASPLPTLTGGVGSSGTLGRTSKRPTGSPNTSGNWFSGKESIEREYRNEQTRQLAEKWRTVWILAMERLRSLQKRSDDCESSLIVIRRTQESNQNFDFDQWRLRLLDHCKSTQLKPAEFFRRLDTNNEGALPVQQFAERCLASDFRCSRAEVEIAARQLDRNGDRLVDQQEFVDTLASFKLGDVARSEHEVIMDEVQKQLVKCTCIGRFRVYHVGEGKYRVRRHRFCPFRLSV